VQAAVIFGVHHTYFAPGHKRSLYGRTLAWAICSVSSDNGRPLRPAPRAEVLPDDNRDFCRRFL
jgi:hypothetical protein